LTRRKFVLQRLAGGLGLYRLFHQALKVDGGQPDFGLRAAGGKQGQTAGYHQGFTDCCNGHY